MRNEDPSNDMADIAEDTPSDTAGDEVTMLLGWTWTSREILSVNRVKG